jgi:hypothetical protein
MGLCGIKMSKLSTRTVLSANIVTWTFTEVVCQTTKIILFVTKGRRIVERPPFEIYEYPASVKVREQCQVHVGQIPRNILEA